MGPGFSSFTHVQVRIMLSVLQFRLNRRYVEADPPFVAIELDQSDSGREGCAVSTLTITSEPGDWRGAVQVPIKSSCLFFLFLRMVLQQPTL